MYLKYKQNPIKKEPNVLTIQRALNSIRPHETRNSSYNWPQRIAEDGLFGIETRNAIAAFQEIYHLTPPEPGDLGDTTYRKIVDRDREIKTKLTSGQIISASCNSQNYIHKSVRPSLRSSIEAIGTSADWSNLILDSNALWVRHLIDAVPKIYRNIQRYSQYPAFLFSRKSTYYTGSIYKQVNVGETLSHHLTTLAYICQVLTIWPMIREYNRKKSSCMWSEMTSDTIKTGGAILQLILGTPDALIKIRRLMRTHRFLLLGANTTTTGVVASLSRINAYIGAFLIGWTIGELIGKIPCGNGHNIQFYIDQRIDEIWEHPYKTIGLMPGGLAIATLIAGWKECIDLWVNRIDNLKPLTEEEKKKLELYLTKV